MSQLPRMTNPSPSEYPDERELARQYFAQLDPNSVSADEYALAMLEASDPSPPKAFGFPEGEVDDE